MTAVAETDPLQGIRDEAQSAWENAQKFWALWPTVDPDQALDLLAEGMANMHAFTALVIEIAQMEARK